MRAGGHVVHVTGTVLVALRACHPAGGLPQWFGFAVLLCPTEAAKAAVYLSGDDVMELAGLLTTVWWECLQVDGAERYARACQTCLAELEV